MATDSMRFEVTRLNCGGCAGRAQKALAAVPGVTDASVNLANRMARVLIEMGAGPGHHVGLHLRRSTDMVVAMLADRGRIDYSAKVTKYWPEYGQNGKQSTEIRHFMGHTAGLPGFGEKLTLAQLYDWDYATSVLERQEPWWRHLHPWPAQQHAGQGQGLDGRLHFGQGQGNQRDLFDGPGRHADSDATELPAGAG